KTTLFARDALGRAGARIQRLFTRLTGHLEVERRARVWMRQGNGLVELDAEARLGRRNDVALLPADRLAQQLGVQALPALDALEDEKIRAARSQLNVGGAHHRATVQVRRDLRVLHLRERRDLLGLEESAHAPEVRLQDGRAAGGEQPREVIFGGETLTGRDRHA